MITVGLIAVAFLILTWFLVIPRGPSITIEDPWIRPAPVGAAGYMVILNRGGEADVLLSVSTDVGGRVTIHETVMDEGVMKMNPVKELEIPINSKVELKPGGYHIMLQDLEQSLQVGDVVKIHLHLERSEIISLDAPVLQEAPKGAP